MDEPFAKHKPSGPPLTASGSTGSPGAGLSSAFLQEWKGLMRSGLDASRRCQPAMAQALYLRALEFARTLLACPAGGVPDDDRVAAFVATHLDLAESFVDAGQAGAAVPYLCGAHRTLISLLCDESVPAPLQRVACRHVRETHAALIGHWCEHGAHPEITQALRAGCVPFPLRGTQVH